MSSSAPSAAALRVADLPAHAETAFEIVPDAAARAALAGTLGLDGLRKLRLAGRVVAQGASDWRLEARLGATVVQPCSVTLAPVTTRIDADVTRLYLRDFAEPDEAEIEMPEDDTAEPLGAWIDPEAVMVEALALEIPPFPRAKGAALGETVLTQPGAEALRDSDLKPFAGLAELKARMDGDQND